MGRIEKEYNKRFKYKQLPNEDFDVEGLWDEVSTALKPVTKAKSLKRKWLLLLLLLLLLGGTTSILYPYFHNKPSINADKKAIVFGTSNEKSIHSTESKKGSDSFDTNIEEDEPILTSSNSSIACRNEVSSDLAYIGNETNTPSYAINSVKPSLLIHETPSITPTPTNLVSSQTLKDKKANNIPLTHQFSNDIVAPLVPKKHVFLQTSHDITLGTLSVCLADNKLKTKKKNKLNWQIGLYGGANNSTLNYDTPNFPLYEELKNKTEQGQWGSSYGLETSLIWKNKWQFSTGIERHLLWSKFNYEQVNTTQVLKENQLLKIKIDSETRDTLERIYGDTFVNATVTRHVQHYNKYKMWSIPLEFGMQMQKNKWTLGLTTGAILNFIAIPEGKMIDDNFEIVAFSEDNESSPFKSFGLGLRVSPLIGYNATNNLQVAFQPKWTWQKNSISDKNNSNLQILNLNLSIRYILD